MEGGSQSAWHREGLAGPQPLSLGTSGSHWLSPPLPPEHMHFGPLDRLPSTCVERRNSVLSAPGQPLPGHPSALISPLPAVFVACPGGLIPRRAWPGVRVGDWGAAHVWGRRPGSSPAVGLSMSQCLGSLLCLWL